MPTPVPTSVITSPTTTKSLPIGGIVAGAVVGAVAIAAIFAIAWFMIRTRRPPPPSLPAPSFGRPNYEVQTEKPTGVEHTTYVPQDIEAPGTLRYPEAALSGNLNMDP